MLWIQHFTNQILWWELIMMIMDVFRYFKTYDCNSSPKYISLGFSFLWQKCWHIIPSKSRLFIYQKFIWNDCRIISSFNSNYNFFKTKPMGMYKSKCNNNTSFSVKILCIQAFLSGQKRRQTCQQMSWIYLHQIWKKIFLEKNQNSWMVKVIFWCLLQSLFLGKIVVHWIQHFLIKIQWWQPMLTIRDWYERFPFFLGELTF